MRAAIIEKNLVKNIIEVKTKSELSELGAIPVPDYVSVGTGYVAGKWEKPKNGPSEATVRQERAKRLSATDWTQLADTPLTAAQKAAFAAYRQALRDVPTQAGFPANVVWPVSP